MGVRAVTKGLRALSRSFTAAILGCGVIAAGSSSPIAAGQEMAPTPTVVEARVSFSTKDMWSIASDPITVRLSTDGRKVNRVTLVSGESGFNDVIARTVASWRFAPHAATAFSTQFTFGVHDRACNSNTILTARLPHSV